MIQSRLNETLGVRNRGIKQAPFRVLMGATMPAVLVEVAFISSPEEEKGLREPAFKDRIADAVADSVRRFREKFLK
jgi:N-acetylmuramoyl-L-alanine amidase